MTIADKGAVKGLGQDAIALRYQGLPLFVLVLQFPDVFLG